MPDAPSPLAPGTLVDYRGSLSSHHGVCRSQLCEDCPRCSRFGEDEPRYRLTRISTGKELFCARRKSFTVIPIGARS